MRLTSLVTSVLVCSWFAFAGENENQLSADTFELKSGHKISGSVISKEKTKGKTFLVIKTDSGATLKLEKSKFVHRFFTDDAVSKEYEALVAKMSDTPEAHWELYDWCKKKSRPRFRDQMNFHLEQVLRHDPSDKKARSLLKFREFGGSWINERKVLTERGYVKQGDKLVSELQAAVNDQKLERDSGLEPRRTALSRWKSSLRKKTASQASTDLFEIVNEPMVSVIAGKGHLGKAKKDPALRIIYLEAIGRVPSRQAQNLLAEYAIVDPDANVRDRAGILLQNPELYNANLAVGPVARHLRSSDNDRVRRAASLLEEINSPAAILPLIGGLVTKHTIKTGNDPNRTTAGTGTGGTSFNPGGGGPATREVTLSNEEAAQALRSITKQSGFDFDKAAWKDWYIDQHTITEYDFRRDE